MKSKGITILTNSNEKCDMKVEDPQQKFSFGYK